MRVAFFAALVVVSNAAAAQTGGDTKSVGVFTGQGITQPGLSCGVSGAFTRCSGFLPSAVDGTLLDLTLTLPNAQAPYPLVAYVHGYGGSKHTSSDYDDRLAARGFAVLRHSCRGFGDSWGQVNLDDIDVEIADLRSLIGQLADGAFGIDPGAVAVAGASYGGGHAWLAAVDPVFQSPAGKTVTIKTVVPIATWSDLLGALRPNGERNSVDPPGFYKLSFMQALLIGGFRFTPARPYPNTPAYLGVWDAYALAFEPNNAPPIGSSLVTGLTRYRSILWQDRFWERVKALRGSGNQLPIFLAQGFTDDLFPLPEALRMMQQLLEIDPQYPVAAYFGDIGHPRAANKGAELDYVLGLVLDWLDHYLKGGATAPSGVYAAITRPTPGFTSSDVIQLSSWDQLSTGTATATFDAAQVITFDPANVSGLFVDPVVFTGCSAFAQPACAPPPAVVPGDVALYSVPAAQLAASAGRAGSFLVAGQPVVHVTLFTPAPREQLDARLYAVTASGRRLITRGTLTLDPGGPIGTTDVELPTYGNLWELGDSDVVELELTNVDSPYLTPSRVPSVTVLQHVELAVPIR